METPPDQSAGNDLREDIALARSGDQAAAARMVEVLYPVVVRVVRCHLPRRTAEEDLVQEIFMKFFSKLDQFEGQVPVTHWISRIALTTCLDRLRHQQRRPELRMADFTEEEQVVIERLEHTEEGIPSDQAGHAREIVEKILGLLKPEEAMILRLLELEEKTVREIASLTGWSTPLVKVRAFRARASFRKHYEALKAGAL